LKIRLQEFIEQFKIDLLVVENALTIPMHIPLGVALTEYIAETLIPTIAHHHDFYWERTRFSVNAYIQYNTALDGIITNLRFRYNPKEGNDLYLVFNEDRNTDLNRELPYLPVYNSRAVMVKYTYTFNL